MINGVNNKVLFPIFFEGQVPLPGYRPFEKSKEEDSTKFDKSEEIAKKEEEKVIKDLLDLSKNKEESKQVITISQESEEEKKEEEKKQPIPSVYEIIHKRLEEEKEDLPMAYGIKAIKEALNVPAETVEILLRKLGLLSEIDILA
ncbi:hypothetical protein KKB84_08800 [bacterium]|nr:hypothetical protein [bacterium]MBU1154036.1 hypothetical protein [bacterium]MBU1782252.1 hypothetical protein [bacterium]MBU2599756.1 hypothetical protein [bacterium]